MGANGAVLTDLASQGTDSDLKKIHIIILYYSIIEGEDVYGGR